MPILFVHGVAIRDDDYWLPLEKLLRTHAAPIIAEDPANVWINRCYWGDLGSKYFGNSLPNTAIESLSAKAAPLAKTAGKKLDDMRTSARQSIQDARGRARQKASELKEKANLRLTNARNALANRFESGKQLLRLSDLNGDSLSDLTAVVVVESGADSESAELAIIACDEIARESATAKLLKGCKNIEEEVVVVAKLVQERYEILRKKRGLTSKGKPAWLKNLGANLVEGAERYADMPGYLLTRAAAEAKAPINAFVTQFLGDVFTYMKQRGDCHKPGPIPTRLLETLRLAQINKEERNGEPLVVMSHSMGGQILYDVVTHFIPKMPEYNNLRIDFWCATASQVGYFEELKLFLESVEGNDESLAKIARPSTKNLGWWWNVWDHNDFVSWRAGGIFDAVDDERYNTGMFMSDAHGGYLVRPSFFRKFASKLSAAKQANWLQESKMKG